MAINPADITTVQASELPPSEITSESILVHQVGDQLCRTTVSDLIVYLQTQSVSYQYQVIYLRPPGDGALYIQANFDMTPGGTQGIGKPDGLWSGWAICNGNNGTDNLDGQTLIGYGANHGLIGAFLGEEEHLLTVNEMPSHKHKGNGFGGAGSGVNGLADNNFLWSQSADTSSVGGDQPHNNMQPSRVYLAIMRL